MFYLESIFHTFRRVHPEYFVTGVRPDKNGDYIINDMVLTKEQITSYFGLSDGGSYLSAGIIGKKYRWPHGEMPYK